MSLLSPSQLKPEIQKALAAAGLDKKRPQNVAELQKSELDNLLESSGLDSEKILTQVGELMQFAENESVRLSAAKIGLQLNKLLDSDEVSKVPIVNIIINDSEYASINPILIPR